MLSELLDSICLPHSTQLTPANAVCLCRWLHLPTFQVYYQAAGLLLVVVPIVFGALAYANRRPGQVSQVTAADFLATCPVSHQVTVSCVQKVEWLYTAMLRSYVL
jgi:hypothetical protein